MLTLEGIISIRMTTSPKELKPAQTLGSITPSVAAPSSFYKAGAPIFSVGFGTGDGIDLVAGGLYAIKIGTPSARFPVVKGLIKSGVELGLPVYVATAAQPTDFIERLDVFGDARLGDWLLSSKVELFSTQDEISKKIFRLGADRFTRELEEFGVPERSFLLFDEADDLISLHDLFLARQQVEKISAWCRLRNVTMLFTFLRASAQKVESLNALMDHFAGVASLGGDRQGLEINYSYWRTSIRTITAQARHLVLNDEGYYTGSEIAAKAAEPKPVMSPAPQPVFQGMEDHGNYLFQDPDLMALSPLAGGQWEQLLDLNEYLPAALQSPKSIALMTLSEPNEVGALAQAIFDLRTTVGRDLSIVVCAKLHAFSALQERYFLSLGANAIVGIDIPLSQYQRILQAIRRQRYAGNCAEQFVSFDEFSESKPELNSEPLPASPQGLVTPEISSAVSLDRARAKRSSLRLIA